MNNQVTGKNRASEYIYYAVRIAAVLLAVLVFFPGCNPAKICGYINKNMSLFTSGIAYADLTKECVRAFSKGWVQESTFVLIFISCLVTVIGIIGTAAMGCMSLGNTKLKKLGNLVGIGGCLVQLGGLAGIYAAYSQLSQTVKPEKVEPVFQTFRWWLFAGIAIFILVGLIITLILMPKVEPDEKFHMESKYQLFLMFLPFAALCFVFSYLPLYGWRYAFYDYTSGGTLSADNFVGLQWFTTLFQNEQTRMDIMLVLRNTLVMSGLGLLTSWCPMAFAIFLSEIKTPWVRKIVQTFTTIPNFISWVLVYAIAFAIFATDGFISSLMINSGVWTEGKNFLMSSDFHWFKMLAWGMWKGIGWSAIIYIAGISGIDQQLYEAATVDGAGRFQKMWHITVPGLIPTFMVMLLMAIAGILSNGMDQYMVFDNPNNTNYNMVLDFYVYKLGLGQGQISFATMVGMVKSVISVVLLFIANSTSKLLRGESIV